MLIRLGDTEANAYVAESSHGSGPGVLVFHAWWGLTEDVKHACDQLASEGFTAMAIDYFGGRTASSIEEAEALRGAWDRNSSKALARAAADILLAHEATRGDVIGTIGYSLGASLAVWLADSQPKKVGAVVLYYGLGSGNQAKTRARYLGHFAETDPYVKSARREKLAEKLRDNGRPVEFHMYPGTGHWFAEPGRPDAYDQAASELAWARTIAFLGQSLGDDATT